MNSNPGTAQADKVVLREKFRDLRRKFKAGGGRSATEQLLANLRKFVADYSDLDTQFCLYRARRDEAPCNLTPANQFFYPVLGPSGELEFRKPVDENSFQTNKLMFDEPIPEKSAPLDASKPVIVFCPAVALDTQGIRLGLGKGHYDRFFAKHPAAMRVGVVFHVQISSQPLPVDSWDQAMDWIVSEKMILRVKERT